MGGSPGENAAVIRRPRACSILETVSTVQALACQNAERDALAGWLKWHNGAPEGTSSIKQP